MATALSTIAANFQNDEGVRTKKPGYTANAGRWKRCRDAAAGSDAIKAAGTDYLPMLGRMKAKDYAAYVYRASFYNASQRTINGLKGMIFRKPPAKDVPKSDLLDEYLKDVTFTGIPLDVFTNNVVEEKLTVGDVGILVDHPPMPQVEGGLTVAQAQSVGMRPSIKTYCIENVWNWKYRMINNKNTLCQVVLYEKASIPVTEFVNRSEDNWRVLDLTDANVYRVRLFKLNDKGEDEQIGSDVYPMINGKAINYIPFRFVSEQDFTRPPMLDLIDVNLQHYLVSADYEHGCHFTGLPMLYVAGGVKPNSKGDYDPIYLGSTTALILNDPQAKVGFAEFTGQGLQSLKDNLDRKEQQMAILGARMLAAEKKQAETATTSAIHRTGENSILADISIEVSLALTDVLKWFVEWTGLEAKDVTYELNRDFAPITVDGPTLTSYMAAYQAGALTDEELFDLLQRGDLIEAEQTFDEHMAELKTSQPALDKAKQDQLAQDQFDLTKQTTLNPPIDPNKVKAK